MTFQNIVLTVYPSIVKRIHSWVLPLVLFLSYGSIYCLKNGQVLDFFSRIGIATVHIYTGFLLILLLAILFYDLVFRYLTRQNGNKLIKNVQTTILGRIKSITPRTFIDYIFYLSLLFMCLVGLLLYSYRFSFEIDCAPDQTTVAIVHSICGWFFLSVVPIKYYLSLTRWYEELIAYLRAD